MPTPDECAGFPRIARLPHPGDSVARRLRPVRSGIADGLFGSGLMDGRIMGVGGGQPQGENNSEESHNGGGPEMPTRLHDAT